VPVEHDVPLSGLTSIGLGGPAAYLARPTSVDEVQALLAAARRHGMPVRILGRGTNLFVDDAGVAGLVIAIGPRSMNAVTVDAPRVVAGAGVRLGHLVNVTLEHGLAGLEALVGIPGSVGGAIPTNAGTRDGDIGSLTAAITTIDREGHVVRLDRSRLEFGYRTSSIGDAVVVKAELDLMPADADALKRRADDLWQRRKATQPVGRPTAGCVFKNPPDVSAGQLIDRAGLKGARIGGMEISRQHANFFINRGGATFDDARRLIDRVRHAVRTAFTMELELEVEIWQDRGPQAGTLKNAK